MSAQLTSLDTSILPIDVLSFYDKHFYDLVAKIVGVGAAKLFEIQGIRSVYSFLNTVDVFEILELSCPALKDVRSLISLEAADHTFIVQPGCRSGVGYLRQLLKQKHEENLNEITKKSRRRKQHAQTNDNSSKNHSEDVSQGAATVSNLQHNTTSLNPMKEDDHRDFIISTLNEWFEKYSSIMKISDGKLIEHTDFTLSLVCNDVIEEANFSCSCGIKVQLAKYRNTFSLSNYYKHLKSKACTMIKKKITPDNHANDQSTSSIDQESFDDEPSQNSSLNRTQSSITSTSTTSYIDRLLKRSTISEDATSKRRRTQK